MSELNLPALRLECLRLAVQLLPYDRQPPLPDPAFLGRQHKDPVVLTTEQRVRQVAESFVDYVQEEGER